MRSIPPARSRVVTRRDPVRTRRESPGAHDRVVVARERLVIERLG